MASGLISSSAWRFARATTRAGAPAFVAGERLALRHAAQPGELALGELARGECRVRAGRRAVRRPAPPRPGGSPRSASRAGRDGVAARAGAAPRRPARRRASASKRWRCARAARRLRVRAPAAAAGGRRLSALAVESRDRPAGLAEHLQRALDALRIGGGRRAAVGGRRAPAPHAAPASRWRPRRRARRARASASGIVVEASNSALKYSIVPPTSSGSRPRARISAMSRVRRRRTLTPPSGLRRVEDVDQVVRHLRALGGVAGGADVHAAVDQGRVDADDLHRQQSCRRSPSAAAVLPAAVGPAKDRHGQRFTPGSPEALGGLRLAVALHQRPGHDAQRQCQRREAQRHRVEAGAAQAEENPTPKAIAVIQKPDSGPGAGLLVGKGPTAPAWHGRRAGARRGRCRTATEAASPPTPRARRPAPGPPSRRRRPGEQRAARPRRAGRGASRRHQKVPARQALD